MSSASPLIKYLGSFDTRDTIVSKNDFSSNYSYELTNSSFEVPNDWLLHFQFKFLIQN